MTKAQSFQPLHFGGAGVFDLDVGVLDPEFRLVAKECIEAQKAAAQGAMKQFVPNPLASAEVSEEALHKTLRQGRDVHGIATERSISNVIPFGGYSVADAIRNSTVTELRERVDARMKAIAQTIFPGETGLTVTSSGHFWYPPGSCMGWHTNSEVPGWRVYINYAEEEGKSFFRYRDPEKSEVITLLDKEWNIRLFKITKDHPFWHAVYSDTNRFSIGYMIYKRTLTERVLGRIWAVLRG
jgi:hypothetical protein